MAVVRLDNIEEITKKLGINSDGEVQKFFTAACRNRMDKYVPKGDTGNLRNVVRMETNSVTYEMPYAHAQYVGIVHGYPVKNYTTPGTGSYWDKKMVSAEKNELVKEVAEFSKRRNK